MMQTKYLLALSLSLGLSIGSGSAQTVFTVGKEAVSKAEFLSWYQKNNSQDLKYDKTSLENFANLYALYKMKVMEADALQLDTIPEMRSDIDMYRAQLAKNYIADKSILDKLVKEAYERKKLERKVAHIMLNGYGDAADEANHKKLDSLATAINSGKITFEAAAKQYSVDKGTAVHGGSLGYINAFQTPYDFENVAYTTAVGSISKPFKSPYGYHLLKVIAERPSIGTLEVAQILLATDGKDNDELLQKIELAKKIRQEAQSGTAFESLVQQYSDDEFSKDKGGLIAPITSGSTDELVEQTVLSLKKPGDISEPLVTNFGVHLFKLVAKKDLESFEVQKPALQAKLEQSRAEVLKAQNIAVARKEVGFKEHSAALGQLIETVDQGDFGKDKKLGDYPQLKAVMFEIGAQKYNQQDFLSYVKTLTQGRLNGRKEDAFRELYRIYSEKQILDAQMKNLEKTSPEFKKLAGEYRNGVLIFDMMDKNIWSKANKDTLGLRTYYEKNANKYTWNPGFTGVVFQSKNHEALQQILAALQAGASVEDALAKMQTPSNAEKVYQQTGRFDFEHVPKVDKKLIVAQKPLGIYPDGKDGEVVILADEVYNAPVKKTFAEARDQVVDEYQKELEKQWEAKLKQKYPLKINTSVLTSMVK
ncbi:MAG: peptidylprolyl isomerase [Taibaiella sp.]|nr:peptidylprolyl isomerase [Taibaiella sp.]